MDELFSAEIKALILGLNHVCQEQILTSGQWIQEAQPDIECGVKWNSMSFRTTEWFATLNKNAKDRVEYVFHLGAKPREQNTLKEFATQKFKIVWKSPDRCIVSLPEFSIDEDLKSEFQEFVRQWVRSV